MTYYWMTLVISAEELAAHLECPIEEIEDQDYLGAIRDFGEIQKLEEIEE